VIRALVTVVEALLMMEKVCYADIINSQEIKDWFRKSDVVDDVGDDSCIDVSSNSPSYTLTPYLLSQNLLALCFHQLLLCTAYPAVIKRYSSMVKKRRGMYIFVYFFIHFYYFYLEIILYLTSHFLYKKTIDLDNEISRKIIEREIYMKQRRRIFKRVEEGRDEKEEMDEEGDKTDIEISCIESRFSYFLCLLMFV
jgi:hypothetical protein